MTASLPPVPKGFMTKGINEQKRQCTYNATLRRVRATIVVVKKAINIAYSGGVFVALGIQNAQHMRRVILSSGGLSCSTVFFHIISHTA